MVQVQISTTSSGIPHFICKGVEHNKIGIHYAVMSVWGEGEGKSCSERPSQIDRSYVSGTAGSSVLTLSWPILLYLANNVLSHALITKKIVFPNGI